MEPENARVDSSNFGGRRGRAIILPDDPRAPELPLRPDSTASQYLFSFSSVWSLFFLHPEASIRNHFKERLPCSHARAGAASSGGVLGRGLA